MRSIGFERPFSRDQVTSWVIQLLLIGSFITFASTLLSRDKSLSILLPNAILLLTVITSWCICETRDPSKPKPLSFIPAILKVSQKESRYCGVCFKISPGLDHHCTWLNTCIAESNYEAFYCLVVSATCQTLLQTVIGVLMCTLWKSEVRNNAAIGWDSAVIILLWIHNVTCIVLTTSFALLVGFHTYLLCIGMGTYDFILANGSEGLCTRMLKCTSCCRKKPRNINHGRVHHGDAIDVKGANLGVPRTRFESASAAVVPADSIAPSSLQLQVPRADIKPVEHAVASTKVEVNLSLHINESEDVYEEVELNNPLDCSNLDG